MRDYQQTRGETQHGSAVIEDQHTQGGQHAQHFTWPQLGCLSGRCCACLDGPGLDAGAGATPGSVDSAAVGEGCRSPALSSRPRSSRDSGPLSSKDPATLTWGTPTRYPRAPRRNPEDPERVFDRVLPPPQPRKRSVQYVATVK